MTSYLVHFRRALLLVAVLAFGIGSVSAGQQAKAVFYSRLSGDVIRAVVEIEINAGWHLYHTTLGNPDAIGIPTTVSFSGEGVEWSQVRFPIPHRTENSLFGNWYYTHSGRIVLYAAGKRVSGSEAPAAVIDGQTCSDSGACMLYHAEVKSSGAGPDSLFANFPGDLVVPSLTDMNPPLPVTVPPLTSAGVDYAAATFPVFSLQQDFRSQSGLVWLLLAFLAGMILNIMPCVLPVVSIKVFSFVHQAGEHRGRVLALGLAFAAGIVVVFWGLAGAAILFGLNWGEQFQSPAFMIFLISVIFLFALSLFDVYEFAVPRAVGHLASGPPREGLLGAFFKGMLTTLLATPCSGPFLGSTLAWTLDQAPVTVFLIFTALGAGMAFPYVALTGFPSLLRLLPKPGQWMVQFKEVMGFMLLGTVLYLMLSLRQDLLIFTNCFLVFIALGCWIWGTYAKPGQPHHHRTMVALAILLSFIGGGYLSFGVFREGFSTQGREGEQVPWEAFEPDRFNRLLRSGQTVFVDFTAAWCPNCKYNEKVVFESEAVRSLLALKGVVCLKADMTHDSARTAMLKRLLTSLGGRSIPYLAIFPGDQPIRPRVKADLVTVETMVTLLKACPTKDTNLKKGEAR